MADLAPQARKHAAKLAKKHDMLLVAGSMPWHIDPENPAAGQTNSAMIFTPEGDAIIQDKLSLTPGEQEPENWNLTPGKAFNVIKWRGLNVAVLICLDIEMPALSCVLAPLDIDLLLVPSMTLTPSGYNRVFGLCEGAGGRTDDGGCGLRHHGCGSQHHQQSDQLFGLFGLYPVRTAIGPYRPLCRNRADLR